MDITRINASGKWTILIIGAITNLFLVAVPFMCMPVLFKEMSANLGLNLVEIGIVWGIIPLAGIIISFPGGMLIDRIGIKNSLVIGCILGGLLGGARGLSVDLLTLAGTSFLYALLNAFVPGAVFKMAAIFFSGKQRGMAQGIVSAGMGVGALIGSFCSATIFSPLLGGWRNVMFLYGGLGVLMGLVWLFVKVPVYKPANTMVQPQSLPFVQLVKKVVRMRDVWILGLVMLGYNACFQGLLGYTPMFLRNIGWTPVSADLAFALIPVASVCATIPITYLSDRLGSRRGIVLIIMITGMIGTALLAVVRGPVIWLLCILIGLGRDSYTAISMAMNYEIEEVDATTAATAMGLVNSLSRVGAVIAPPLGNSLVGIDPGLPFVPWAAFVLVSFSIFFMRKGNLHTK